MPERLILSAFWFCGVVALAPVAMAAQLPSRSGQHASIVSAEQVARDSTVPTLQTVIVSGKLPGPGLWRVTQGRNTLYILASISPLPAKMEWDASRVEQIIADAQEVLAPGGVDAKIGMGDMFKMASLARSAVAATKIPGGKSLKDILPPRVFAAWQVSKQKYMPADRDAERRRPVMASTDLWSHAIDGSGLTRSDVIWEEIEAVAKARGVLVSPTRIKVPLAIDRRKFKAGIARLANADVDETTCFSTMLDTLEADLETMRLRANAWAVGDLGRVTTAGAADPQPACKQIYDALMGFQRLPEVEARADEAWLVAAKKALANNVTTFAVLPLDKLTGPNGALEQLGTAGYEVQAPGSPHGRDEPGPGAP